MRVVPFHRPLFGREEEEALLRCLRSGWWTSGPEVQAFEEACAEKLGCAETVALSSATDALELMLRTHGIGPGDEVITVSLTFVATVEVVLRLGARPRLADIDPKTGCMDPDSAAGLVNERSRAILVVHLGGQPAAMRRLRALADEHGLLLFEDAAHAFETTTDLGRAGLASDGGAFSFYVNKNLATGEGGLLVLKDGEALRRARLLRCHGMTRDAAARGDGRGYRGYDIAELGMKANMSDFAAALGRAQLGRLEAMRERRRAIVARYDAAFRDQTGLLLPPRPEGDGHAWHLYALRLQSGGVAERDRLIDALADRGVGSSVHYRPLHLMTGLRRELARDAEALPETELWGERCLSLPLHPALDDEEVEQVIAALLTGLETCS